MAADAALFFMAYRKDGKRAPTSSFLTTSCERRSEFKGRRNAGWIKRQARRNVRHTLKLEDTDLL
ncbi:hypothetical protein GCM10008957_22950 [Deinococcus ruber]|uniref:Uncharacterized protein n=1 Tax=Deinococcus ruber TaxID=1848197 RepID=A0A918C7G1_9DEIO|nr:hypothetical protein GCM10008957_22950 [Deinococcus ruber]